MKKEKRYIILGGGISGRQFYSRMHDKIDLVGFSDNNLSLQGRNISFEDINGLKYSVSCIAPDDIDKDVQVIIAAAPNYYYAISDQLQRLHLEYISAEQFVFEYFEDVIKRIEKCFADDESRKVYCQVWKNRICGNFSSMKSIFSSSQYFAIPEFMNFSGNEIFVDAGSYCGDVLDTYINSRCGLFKKIYAFEPGKKQFCALQCRAERLRREWALEEEQIVCVNGAVSDYNGFCSFVMNDSNIATSRMGGRENQIEGTPVYKLDDFLTDGVDFIKADIEGQEMALLRGASKTIMKYKPKLAICLYHTPFDMFEIPEYIRKIMPDYKMKVRHHTYNTSETVLYAYYD